MGKVNIDRIRVASPCAVPWDSMKGNESLRHCDLCSLNVYNISELTVAETEQLIAVREGRICIRLYRRADGTVITKDCPVGLRKVRQRMTRIASAAFASILGLVTLGYGQKDNDSASIKDRTVEVESLIVGESIVKGTIVDPTGAVIPNIVVTLSNFAGTKTVISNNVGGFAFPTVEPGEYTLAVSGANGFDGYRREKLIVRPTFSIDFTIALSVISGVELIGVVGNDSEMIELGSSTIRTVVNERKLRSLPFE